MTANPVAFNAADFLEASPALLARTVLEAALPLETASSVAALVAYYTSRLPALGLDLQQTIAAIAAAVPSARAHIGLPCDAPGHFTAAQAMNLRAAILGAADAERYGMIEQAFDRVAGRGGRWQPASDGDIPGEVRVEPAAGGVASTYLHAESRSDWRAGLTSSRSDVTWLLAVHDQELGLLLGAGMIYTGVEGGDATQTLPPGLALCGPRATLPPGRYWLDADIWLGGMDRLHLDIASNRGLRRLADMELRGSFRMTLGFAVGPEDEALEVRLTNETGGPVAACIKRLAVRM